MSESELARKHPPPSRLPSKIAKPAKLLDSDKSESSISALAEDPDSFIVGDRVWVGGTKPGVIAFIGETQFGPGDWAGVVLDEVIGKNDGSVAGVRYFQCASNKGVFSRLSRLSRSPVDFSQIHDTSYVTPVSPDCRSISSFSYASSTGGSINRSHKSLNCAHLSGSDVKLGNRVIVQSSQGSKAGVLRYYGNTEFGSGLWCGVELDEPLGKNDGTVAGVRYFKCEPKFGLFVPAEKVSRSPISKKKSSACVVHPEGISRQGTLESICTTSTIQTSASAIKSRRSAARNSLTQGISTPPCISPHQIRSTEKDRYISQLLRERELERAQVTRAATQAEEAEKKLYSLKTEYDRLTVQYEIDRTNQSKIIEALEAEKIELKQQLEEEKKKIEDLVFSYEEESITKSEIQALNEEYAEKLKHLEKVVNSQHTSLEYDVNFHSPEKSCASQEAPIDSEVDEMRDENIDFRLMATLLDEQKKQLESKCSILKTEIDKLILIDRNKDEIINNLKNEINNCQPLNVLDSNVVGFPAGEKFHDLKDNYSKLEFKNKATEEQLHVVKLQLKQIQDDLIEKTAVWQTLEINMKHELEAYKEKNELMIFQINQLNLTLLEKEEQLKSNSQSFLKCIKTFSNYLSDRNEIINSALFGNDSFNNAIDTLRSKNMTCSSIFDDDSDTNANIVNDFSDNFLQLKDEFLKLKEFVDQMINANVASLEKLVTMTEVISRKDELLEEMSNEKDTLRREFQDAMESDRSEIDVLKNRYGDLNKVKLIIEKQFEKSEENLKKIEKLMSTEHEVAHIELEKIRKELEAKCTAHELACEELLTLKDKINHINAEKKVEHDTLREEINRFKNSLDTLRIENEKNSALFSEKEKFENECNVFKLEVNDLKNSLDKLRKENDEYAQSLAARAHIEAERDVLQQEVKELKNSLKESNSFLRNEVENSKNEREAVKKESEDNVFLLFEKTKSDLNCKALQQEISHLKGILDASLDENEKTSLLMLEKAKSDEKIEALLLEVDNLQNTVERLRKENERNVLLLAEKAHSDARCESLQKTVENFNNVIESLNKEKENVLQQEKAESDAKRSILQEEIDNLRNVLETLNKQNENNAELLVVKSRTDAKYKCLEQKLVDVENALETARKKNENNSLLHTKNNDLELEVGDLKQQLKKLRLENEKYAALLAEKAEALVHCEAFHLKLDNFKITDAKLQEKSENNQHKVDILNSVEKLQNENAPLLLASKTKSETEYKTQSLKITPVVSQNENEDNVRLLREKADCNAESIIFQKEVENLEHSLDQLSHENEKIDVLVTEKVKSQTECGTLQQIVDELENNLESVQKENVVDAFLLPDRAQADVDFEVVQKESENLRKSFESSLKENEKNVLLLAEKAQSDVKYDALKESSHEQMHPATNTSSKISNSPPVSQSRDVEFLNSVIVELQHKNESLVERLCFLEDLVPPEKLKSKKVVTPRLFCDICDIFDAHDTEDCHIQCNEPKRKCDSLKIKPLPRPYCETCEVFGHDTGECDDETF